jgi:hypothetical protein
MSRATGPEDVGAPMLASATRLSMQAQVDSMKSMMVQRVSNADRARYALRASPDAYPRKDEILIMSIQKKNYQRKSQE